MAPDRDTLIATLRETASRLGTSRLTRTDFLRHSGVKVSHIERHFDRFRDLVRAAGLTPAQSRYPAPDDELLAALREAIIAAKGVPERPSRRRFGRYDFDRYTARWGGWIGALSAFAAWIGQREPDFPHLPDVLQAVESGRSRRRADRDPDSRRYGRFINWGALLHAPVNESGVVFLFGALAGGLGFVIESIGAEFPDCVAKRRIDGDCWERVRIEFEHRSTNFKRHGHDPKGCDIVVCWEHDWRECPLEIIELRGVISGPRPPATPDLPPTIRDRIGSA